MSDVESEPQSDTSEPESVDSDQNAREAAHLEIQHVTDNVETIQSNIHKLADTANQFNTKDYVQDLASAQKFLDKLNKQCAVYEENLMQVWSTMFLLLIFTGFVPIRWH